MNVPHMMIPANVLTDHRIIEMGLDIGPMAVACLLPTIATLYARGGGARRSQIIHGALACGIARADIEAWIESAIRHQLITEREAELHIDFVEQDFKNIEAQRAKWAEAQSRRRGRTPSDTSFQLVGKNVLEESSRHINDSTQSHADMEEEQEREQEPESYDSGKSRSDLDQLRSSGRGERGEPPVAPVAVENHQLTEQLPAVMASPPSLVPDPELPTRISKPPGFREGATACGEFRHVWLKAEEFHGLAAEYGRELVIEKIRGLDAEIENGNRKYRKYKNHYATVGNWCRLDTKKARAGPKFLAPTAADTFEANLLKMHPDPEDRENERREIAKVIEELSQY